MVQVGVIQGGDAMQALLRLMSTLYAPQFISGNQWPESIKKDFIGMITRFGVNIDMMSSLKHDKPMP